MPSHMLLRRRTGLFPFRLIDYRNFPTLPASLCMLLQYVFLQHARVRIEVLFYGYFKGEKLVPEYKRHYDALRYLKIFLDGPIDFSECLSQPESSYHPRVKLRGILHCLPDPERPPLSNLLTNGFSYASRV